MKLFRKLSALALAVLLVCALSASAFASGTFNDVEIYDEEVVLIADASISNLTSTATMTLEGSPTNSENLQITGLLHYFDQRNDSVPCTNNGTVVIFYSTTAADNRGCSLTITKNMATVLGNAVVKFNYITYAFSAGFNSYSGYHQYNRTIDLSN